MLLEQNDAIDPHDHAVVSAGLEFDSFRARREPNPLPTDEVVLRKPAELVEEGKVDGVGGVLDDRHSPDVDRERIGVARQAIVEAARKSTGRRETVRQEPRNRQENGCCQVP